MDFVRSDCGDGRVLSIASGIRADGDRLGTSRSSREEEKRLVVVKWRDILADDSWTRATEVECPSFYSVGWLVCDNNDTIKIASTLDFDDPTDEAKGEARPIPYGITAFPKGCVEEVIPLSDKLEWLSFVLDSSTTS